MPVNLPLGKVADGAVLAADVLDAQGNVLLARGTQLTRAHLQLIERRSIAAVLVATAEELAAAGGGAAAPDAGRLAEVLARHDRVFAKAGDGQLMQAIRRASRAEISRGGLPPD